MGLGLRRRGTKDTQPAARGSQVLYTSVFLALSALLGYSGAIAGALALAVGTCLVVWYPKWQARTRLRWLWTAVLAALVLTIFQMAPGDYRVLAGTVMAKLALLAWIWRPRRTGAETLIAATPGEVKA